MNIVVFAGGVGTRLWPLSRKKSPKQFEKVVGERSTLQLTVSRLIPFFNPENIYISTNREYIDIVTSQLPQIPKKNIIGEPEMRDVGPAVGLATAILMKEHPRTPMAILWSDHLVKEEELFRKILIDAEDLVSKKPNVIVFISQKPRFASQNLGWIEYGEKIEKIRNTSFHRFIGFKYRPDATIAERFFKSGRHAWNLGYFVTTPFFLWQKFAQFAPQMHQELTSIQSAWNTPSWQEKLSNLYPKLEKISFDNAILEKLHQDEAYVISEDLKWSDIGAWEALKEALQTSPEQNITQGKVMLEGTKDSLVYNFNGNQLVVAVDVAGMLVVNTHDVVLVCNKNSVPKIKKIVEGLSGTENEHLT